MFTFFDLFIYLYVYFFYFLFPSCSAFVISQELATMSVDICINV